MNIIKMKQGKQLAQIANATYAHIRKIHLRHFKTNGSFADVNKKMTEVVEK